jgi:hypothetical protein
MTDAEFDAVYEESECDGSRDKIIAFLIQKRKELTAENARLNNRINNLLIPMQDRLIERHERMKEALQKIVRGGYCEGADVAHPAVAVARETLAALSPAIPDFHEPKN